MKINLYPVAQASGFVCLLVSLTALFFAPVLSVSAAGTWIPLQNLAPENIGTMLLLPDGTVMAQGGGSASASQNWYCLTPTNNGYTNGTWTTRSTMTYSRLYYASQVLPDGRVFFAGAEYGNGTTNAETYNLFNNSWTPITVPAGIINPNNTINATSKANQAGFVDSGSALLDNGRILIEPVVPATSSNTCIYDSIANSWTTERLVRGANEDEASWVKLPDGSILTVDFGTTNSERYIPALNQWVDDGNVPVNLYDQYGLEMGPGLLLPNGNAFFIGSTPYTAIYIPSGNASPGRWVRGPNIPGNLGAPDAPAAMMNNGKILCCLSPTPFGLASSNIFTTPTYFYEYDYTVGSAGAFVQVSGPAGLSSFNIPTYPMRLLDLPDGTVLYSSGSSQLYVYKPDNAPLAVGKPSIASVSYNAGGTIHLTGTLFNGISAGAAYGDDVQTDSNFPLVRFTGGGNVYYGITFNWSTTGVQTGSRIVSTECVLPSVVANGPGAYSMQVVANGIASDPVAIGGPVWVDFNFQSSPFLGTYNNPYVFISQGVNAVASGGSIFIKPGTTTEPITITKPLTIVAVGGNATVGVHP